MYKDKNLLRHDKRYISDDFGICGAAIKPCIERKANIYKNEDVPSALSFTVTVERPMRLKCEIVYPWEKTEFLSELSACGETKVELALPDLTDIYGIFRIDITGYGAFWENLGTDSIPFSHIRQSDEHFRKCGVCAHMIYHDTWETYDCIPLIKDLGCRSVRDDFLWCFAEPEMNKVIIPENYENTINAFVKAGIEPNLLFLYGNRFHDDGNAPFTDEGRAAYAKYCVTVLKHFKGKVRHCEIWNEFNLLGGFNPAAAPPETYTEMLKAAYTAIKKECPEVEITAGVTCSPHTYWLKRVFEAGAYDYCDAVSLHPYCQPTYPDNGQGDTEKNTQLFIDIIKQYGSEKPVWISEIGWTTSADESGASREDQAANLTRLFALTETGNTIYKTIMYDFRDDGCDPFEMEQHWGFVEASARKVPHAAKESYAAVSQLNFMTSGKKLLERKVWEKLQIMRYDNCILMWSLDGEKSVSLSGVDISVYDMYGNRKSVSDKIKVNENPIYITGNDVRLISVSRLPYENKDFEYTVALIPEFREGKQFLKIRLNSHTAMLKGRIRFEIPELGISCGYSRFLLGRGESTCIETEIPKTDMYKTYGVLTEVSLADGRKETGYEKVSFMKIPYRDDGNTVISLSAPKDYVSVTDTPVPELKADISLSYDEEYFYLNAAVHDKTHLQLGSANTNWQDIWDGDFIEFCLEPLYDGNKNITRYNEIGIAKTSNTGEDVAWRWRTVLDRGYGRYTTAKLSVERKSNVTEYRAAFKWEELLPAGITLNNCYAFGFALRVGYANSDPRSLDGYMQLYGGIGSWRDPLAYNPMQFGLLSLQKKQ